MFGASCRVNCGKWQDCGGIMGRCNNTESPFYNQPTRHDFSCAAHPLKIRMIQNTFSGVM